MTYPNAFRASETIKFVVKNNLTNKSINIFNQKINPGGTYDLMKIPGITEEDIRAELTKGSLKNLLVGGSLVIVSSTVNLITLDNKQNAVLKTTGLTNDQVNPSATQANWFIDPTSGNDANDGATSATALKTHAELERRLREITVKPATTVFGGIFTLRVLTINLLGDLPSSDPVRLSEVYGSPDLLINYKGTTTTVRTGSFTTVVTKNRVTNQLYNMTDSARTVPWSTDGYTRLRITASSNPANVGGLAWVITDLGSNTCVTSDWAKLNTVGFQGVTPITPLVGDIYVVETLSKAQFKKDWTIRFSGERTVLSTDWIIFDNINWTNGNGRSLLSFATNCQNSHRGCKSEALGVFANVTGNSFFARFDNCLFMSGANHGGDVLCTYAAGATMAVTTAANTGLNFPAGWMRTEIGGTAIYDFDFLVYGGGSIINTHGGRPIIGRAAVFNSAAGASVGLGYGLALFSASIGFLQIQVSGGCHLWGSGNARKGIYVGVNCLLQTSPGITTPTITGTLGDFVLGGDGTKTNIRTWDDGYYHTDGYGGYTPLIDATWANFDLPIASGGLGKTAVDPLSGAKIGKSDV